MKIAHQSRPLTLEIGVLIAVAVGFLCITPEVAHAATFTVSNTSDSGAGSLRQAIVDAEAAPGADVIQFSIGGAGPHVISLATALPVMAQQTTIDACTEPDADCSGFPAEPSVQIDLSAVATNSNGLGFFDTADGSIVRGLSIVGNDAGSLSNAIGINDADNMIIEHNLIGLSISGVANANRYGIVAYGTNNLQLGTAGKGNVISGNYTAGVISDPTPLDANTNVTNFSMKGNWIGLGLDGITPHPNTGAPSPSTTIAGIYIGNGNNNTSAIVGGATAAERNVFAASGRSSLELGSFSDVSVQGNYFETTANGLQVVTAGLASFGGSGHLSLAFNPGVQNNIDVRDNVFANVGISGGVYSVGISANTNSVTNNLVVQHNNFGIASNGTSTLRANNTDLYHGIAIYQTPNALIGGPNAADRNYFSNTGAAIYTTTAGGIDVENNYINFDTNGAPLNVPMAIGVFVGTGNGHEIVNNRIGRTDTAGIRLGNSGLPIPTNTIIQGNYIGTTVNGMAKATSATSTYGILSGSDDTVIGGTTAGERNVISGHWIGISFAGSRTTIVGNYVGVASDGVTPIINTNGGIWASGATNAQIGGVNTGEANIVANNTYGGILVDDTFGHSEGVSIRGNSIYSNGALGINLENTPTTLNPTPNDDGDGDAGGNDLQNFPLLNRVEICDGTTQQRGSINSLPNTTYIIDFYTTGEGFVDPNWTDEGRTYHSTTTVGTDGSGNGTFALPVGAMDLSMTATNPQGSTSEFGAVRTVAVTSCSVDIQTTSDTTPALGGGVAISGIASPVVEIIVDGQTVAASYDDMTDTWSVADNAFTSLPEGTYSVTIRVTDPVSGISSLHTTSDGLTIDASGPSGGGNAISTTSRSPRLTGTVDDPDANVRVTINDRAYTATNNGDGTWELPAGTISPALEPGRYTARVVFTDGEGNESTVQFSVVIRATSDDATAPNTGVGYTGQVAVVTMLVGVLLVTSVGIRYMARRG